MSQRGPTEINMKIAARNPDLDLGLELETWQLQLETQTWILARNLKPGNCNLKPWPGSWFGT